MGIIVLNINGYNDCFDIKLVNCQRSL